MRCDQLMGLNTWARKFIKGNPDVLLYTDMVTRTYPDGRVETFTKEQRGSDVERFETNDCYVGMGFQEYVLYQYKMTDSSIYKEDVQAEPWSSGPVFFLALKDAKGAWVKESLWTDEEIDNA